MDLVPKVSSDFNSATYWESFFTKRLKTFEWYGNYFELHGILNRYIKAKDDILVVGCGNSTLSEQLYDVGCQKITNIDISKTVIKQMHDRNVARKNMKWLTMDVTKMELEDNTFSAVVDKGTLDAMMSDTENTEHVEQMFTELRRVVRIGGRYICITLAQDHIVRKILNYFPVHQWIVRVHKVWSLPGPDQDPNRMPVFAFIFTKFQPLSEKILELCLDDRTKPTRVMSEETIVEFVKTQQYYALIRKSLVNGTATEDTPPVELYTNDNPNVPRYVITIVDLEKWNPVLKYGIFIIPHGREREWLFATPEGRLQLAGSARFQRMAFVALNRDHVYKDGMQGIQDELSPRVLELAHSSLPRGYKVPFLSIGNDDVGARFVLHRGESAQGGTMVVEDYLGDGSVYYRQLLFENSPSQVQSFVRLKTKTKAKRRKPNQRRSMHDAKPEHDLKDLTPDPLHVSEYVQIMVAGVTPIIKSIKDKFRVLLIGLGGGTMPLQLLHVFRHCHVTAVELDPTVVEVANKWFGLDREEFKLRLAIHVGDGIEHVKKIDQANTSSGGETIRYDVIALDANTGDPSKPLMCPAEEFLESEILQAFSRVLNDQGVFLVNMLSRSRGTKEAVIKKITATFPNIYQRPCKQDVNEVLYCFKNDFENELVVIENWVSKAKSWENTWKTSHNEELKLSDMFENVMKIS